MEVQKRNKYTGKLKSVADWIQGKKSYVQKMEMDIKNKTPQFENIGGKIRKVSSARVHKKPLKKNREQIAKLEKRINYVWR